MLIFDQDREAASEKDKYEYPPSSNASARSRESREKLPGRETGVLVAEVDNVAHEAKTRVGRALHAITVQLARWGLEVNGSVRQ